MVDAPSPPTLLDPRHPLAPALRDAVAARLTSFLDARTVELTPLQPEIRPVLAMTARLLAGGKRLRPAFCVWGYVAAAGLPADGTDGPEGSDGVARLGRVLTASASLELLHVSALVHDDVMDGSDTRRSAPAAHRQFEGLHLEEDRLGDAESFGRAAAILLGDLLVMWSVQMLEEAGLPAAVVARALPIAQAMRTEVTCGQYLDVVAQARPLGADLDRALAVANRVVEYKSARYTVYRPAQLGAAIGGASPDLLAVLAEYGSALGRAFQFRDDLLGVFGDPSVTGKPVGDDLREGKRTVLVAHTLAHTGAAGRALLSTRLGDPGLDGAGVAALQRVIVDAGAQEAVEAMITDHHAHAVATLEASNVSEPGRVALTTLASAAVNRDT